MRLVTVADINQLVLKHGFREFILDLVDYLKQDFKRWLEFDKSPRYAAHVPGGVLELMPIADKEFFAYKCVNGHPNNPLSGKQTVVANGQLSEIKYGFPLLISEMTVLTALRTAATAIIASDYLARQNSKVLAIIGTGAQSEFQVLAHSFIREIKEVRFYDTDPLAMDKFQANLQTYDFKLTRCKSVKEAVFKADIITVCTACKNHVVVIEDSWVEAGVHINALGGDCPGKTELDKNTLFRADKLVVEYKEQSMIEGEIQQLTAFEVEKLLSAELWQVITENQFVRETEEEITIFDSVGFALEDFSVLRLVNALAIRYGIGKEIDLVPAIQDPKNLITVLKPQGNKKLDSLLSQDVTQLRYGVHV